MLTHHASVIQNSSEDHTYKSLYKEEEAQLVFAQSFDVKMITRKK